MKVYMQLSASIRLIGYAAIEMDRSSPIQIRIFSGNKTICEEFIIYNINRSEKTNDQISMERAVLVFPGQMPELLPGWRPIDNSGEHYEFN